MPTENKVEVTLCLTDGTKLTRVENIADITTFLEQHEEYVKVKHGQWKLYPIADDCWQCSVCGILRMGSQSNYCPNCGVKMDLTE